MTITIQQAVAAHQQGKFEEAERLYQEILKVEPNHQDANHNLGVLLVFLDRIPAALPLFKTATETNPKIEQFWISYGNALFKENKFKEAETSFRKVIEIKPNNFIIYNKLGFTLQKLGKIKDAEIIYKKIIELNPNFYKAHTNLGNVQMEFGRLYEAEKSYKKAIELEPNNAPAYSNLGSVQKHLGRLEEAEVNQRKSIELKPDFDSGHYNLGITLYILKQYKKAADEFMLTNLAEGQNYLLKCWFELNDKINFTIQLDKMLEQGIINPVLGSFISRSNIRYGFNKKNPFCNKPLNYVLENDLTKQCDFKNIFVQTAKKILNDDTIINKTQPLLDNGTQTSGNLFSKKNDLIEKMKDTIHSEIEKYFVNFKDSEEGFIKNWPKSYYLNGWLVSMKNGGKLLPHMHEHAWITCSIYINVPQKKVANSGNLVACLDDNEDENNPKKIIDVVTGSICMFPSSLFHYTIPFDADEERIVLAFDVVPK